MDLSDFYPSSEELIDSEIAVLGYLRGNTYIWERHPQVAVAAEQLLPTRIKVAAPTSSSIHISIFGMNQFQERKRAFAGRGPRPNARLTISSLIQLNDNNFTNVSYCLSVCKLKSALSSYPGQYFPEVPL